MLDQLAEVLNKIDSESSTNRKKKILKSVPEELLENFKFLLRISYDPYIKFHINHLKLDEFPPTLSVEHYTFDDLIEDLDAFVEREVTGHDALQFASNIYNCLPDNFKPYLEKILSKNLKIGIARATINSVFPGLIPEFKLGLCQRFKKVRKSQIIYPLLGEVKEDGIRALFFIDAEGEIVVNSREGIPYENFKVLENEIASLGLRSKVIDGEIRDKEFNNLMRSARRLYNVQADNAIYSIWDIIDLELFENEGETPPLLERKKEVISTFANIVPPNKPFDLEVSDPDDFTKTLRLNFKLPHCKILKWEIVYKFEEIDELFLKYRSLGKEGAVLKEPYSSYPFCLDSRRVRDWFKYKIQDHAREVNEGLADYTVRVIGSYPGEKGTKYENCLGGFFYEGTVEHEGEQVTITGNCGGGFSDEQREDFWNRRNELLNLYFDIEAQEISENKKGDFSLRFPQFKGFRLDTSSEN